MSNSTIINNLNNEYVKFYATTNGALMKLLENTGNIIIYQDVNNGRVSSYLGNLFLSSGYGFTDENMYNTYVQKINDALTSYNVSEEIENILSDELNKIKSDILAGTDITNSYLCNYKTSDIILNLLTPQYKVPEIKTNYYEITAKINGDSKTEKLDDNKIKLSYRSIYTITDMYLHTDIYNYDDGIRTIKIESDYIDKIVDINSSIYNHTNTIQINANIKITNHDKLLDDCIKNGYVYLTYNSMFETTGTINFTNSYIFTNTSDNIKGISNANNYKFINDINKVINIESTGYMSYHNYNFPQIITLNNPKVIPVYSILANVEANTDGKYDPVEKSIIDDDKLHNPITLNINPFYIPINYNIEELRYNNNNITGLVTKDKSTYYYSPSANTLGKYNEHISGNGYYISMYKYYINNDQINRNINRNIKGNDSFKVKLVKNNIIKPIVTPDDMNKTENNNGVEYLYNDLYIATNWLTYDQLNMYNEVIDSNNNII